MNDVIDGVFGGNRDDALEKILEERFERTCGRRRAGGGSIFRSKPLAVAAAAVLITVSALALIIPVFFRTAQSGTVGTIPFPNDSARSVKLPGQTQIEYQDDIPYYVPAYSTPSLDELYSTGPYSDLLPTRVLENCEFRGTYLTEYDPVANPDNHKYLAISFKTGPEDWDYLEIRVSEYGADGVRPEPADPGAPDTYDLSFLYAWQAGDREGKEPPRVNGLFRSSDVSRGITAYRIAMFDGLCKADISVICGDYVVSYSYTGREISADAFFNMITSAKWFDKP